MAGLRIKEEETGLGEEDSSDENFGAATRSYRTSVLRKDAQKKEQEQLRIAVEEMKGTFKMILTGFNRLQRPTGSRNIDEEPMPINVHSRTEENSKRMRRGKHFSLDNHDNDEKIPTLVNTLNKLVTRIDTLNYRLEIGNNCVCTHTYCHAPVKNKSGSASCTNIQAGDCESSEMKSANHGTQEIIKGAVESNMTDEKLYNKPPKTECDSKMLESYQLLPTEQQRGSEEQKIHASIIDKLAETSSNNDENEPAITVNMDNDPKQLDIREARNKRDSSGERNSSVQFIRIYSSGLKSVKTDPQEDNRNKTIKEELKNNISAQINIGKNKNEKPNCKPNLKQYEHVQSKGHMKYSSRQKKEMTPSLNIVKNEEKSNTDINFVKTECSADMNRKNHGVGTISGSVASHAAKTLRKANAPFMVRTHLPKEYWDSIFQETYDKAQKIRTSRSMGFDTIICLDTSMSVAEYWSDILDFLRNLINEVEMAQPMEGGLMEHIALVTFGHETCALQHFTTHYQEVLTKIHPIYPEGSTPLFLAVDLCQAILFGSACAPRLRDLRLAPRLLLITDGRPTYRFVTGGLDEPVKYDEDLEKEDVATRLILTSMNIPLFRVYPVAVGNNCDMDFLTAIANSCGGKVMTLSDWSTMAQYGKKMELASKYFGLASLSQDLLVKVLRETSGLPREDIEFITTEVKDQLEYQNNQGTTSDEEEVEGSYQLPPVGSRVRRGPDWNRNDEDNDGPGTILAYSKGKTFSGWVAVEWDKPKKYGRWRFRYRYGAEDAYDIKIPAHEGPRVMEDSRLINIGCEVVREFYCGVNDKIALRWVGSTLKISFHPEKCKILSIIRIRKPTRDIKYCSNGPLGGYRKSSDDGIEEGTIGMVYNTNMGGKNAAKIRWQNGKRGIYSGEALSSGQIQLSTRSRPYFEMWPFDSLQFVRNLRPSANHPSTNDSRQQPPRQEALLPTRGQLSTRELHNPRVFDNVSSDSDVTGEREALTIEHVERCGMPTVDDMNIRNKIRTRKEETRGKETFGGTRNSSYSKTISEQMEAMKSETETAPSAAKSFDNTKKRRIRRSNKNADV